ncbi:GlsB/YeaQ/YmgE family stress response membrane protein [soil metagenome]
MSILLFLVFGIIVGFLARAIMPGKQGMGIVMTALLGIAGSFLGGFVGSMISGRSLLEFNTAGLIGSVLGALAVLAIMGFAARRRA